MLNRKPSEPLAPSKNINDDILALAQNSGSDDETALLELMQRLIAPNLQAIPSLQTTLKGLSNQERALLKMKLMDCIKLAAPSSRLIKQLEKCRNQHPSETPLFQILRTSKSGKMDYETNTWEDFIRIVNVKIKKSKQATQTVTGHSTLSMFTLSGLKASLGWVKSTQSPAHSSLDPTA